MRSNYQQSAKMGGVIHFLAIFAGFGIIRPTYAEVSIVFWLGDLYSGLFTGKRDADINNIKLNKL